MKRKLLTALLLVLVFTVALASCEYLCKNHKYEDGECTKCGKEEPAPECFTVTFDSNGGTSVPSEEVTDGKKATAPNDPTKEGYTFEGWYLGDEEWSFIGYVVTEDMTLTAKWTKNVYSVKIKDGDTVISDLSVSHGEKVIEPETPEKEGYIFDGWYLGDEEWSFDEDVVTESLEIKAKWSAIMYSVKFMSDGDTVATLSVQHGRTMTAPASPVDEGRTFIGWFDNGVVWDFENSVVTGDMTLDAKWLAHVIYVMDGGKNSKDNPETIYSDDEYPMALSDPTKSGYSFKGWYSDSSFTTKVVNIASCREHTLYALWSKDNVNPSDYPWETTNLIFQLTDNSNYQELPSTCRRYLAGDLEGFEDDASTIDSWIADRNEDALKYTNVTVSYEYLPDTSSYSWGQNITLISEEVMAKEAGRPDMYCNFVYDMVAVSLKGAFANLKSTTMYKDDHELAGHNYFEFTDPAYEDNGSGYMYEYMRSLTLSKWKMYCLSSDYFTDMVRAFLIIPVNIGLLETLESDMENEDLYNSDRVTTFNEYGHEETNYTIEDFYQLVYDKQWNYNTLADFAAAVAVEGEDEDGTDLCDTVGFALSSSTNMGASAMLYSTSITIIDREYDVVTGDYTYSYPYTHQVADGQFAIDFAGTNEELISFCANLSNLFKQPGIISVNNNQTQGYGSDALLAIRSRFATNNVLFGGVICLGSLECDVYREMNRYGTGYGIAPVPLYRASYEVDGVAYTDEYNTQIHNIARIGAISYTTEKFAQCTAYLNYQSTHSTVILNEYYDYKLQYDVVGTEVKGNVEMLKYIRKNVRSAFDKAFEDALGRFYSATDEDAMAEQWHTMIKNEEFQLSGDEMRQYYSSLTPKKAWRLYNLENSVYPTLPS